MVNALPEVLFHTVSFDMAKSFIAGQPHNNTIWTDQQFAALQAINMHELGESPIIFRQASALFNQKHLSQVELAHDLNIGHHVACIYSASIHLSAADIFEHFHQAKLLGIDNDAGISISEPVRIDNTVTVHYTSQTEEGFEPES
jgi:hypothetical protein